MRSQDATSFTYDYFCICTILLLGVWAYRYKALFLQPAVEPAEVSALPQDAVLGFEHPVILIGIEQ